MANQAPARVFEFRKAVRKSVPLWIGLGGPSGGGKTHSALRLATGIQRVMGGEIHVIDTEAERAGHYAPKEDEKPRPPFTFNFVHVPFGSPYGPLDYLDVIHQCYARGGRIFIIDSFSHEHESVGGVLEQFEEELERLSGGDEEKAKRIKMLAWKKPKAARRRLINEMLSMPISVIGCFRTKDKLSLDKDDKDKKSDGFSKLGHMPITGSEMIFEFPTRLLFLPQSDGVPTVTSEMPGEKTWLRVPQQFRHLFDAPVQTSEDIGEAMAHWAKGDDGAPSDEELLVVVAKIKDSATHKDALRVAQKAGVRPWTDEQRAKVRKALDAKKESAA